MEKLTRPLSRFESDRLSNNGVVGSSNNPGTDDRNPESFTNGVEDGSDGDVDNRGTVSIESSSGGERRLGMAESGGEIPDMAGGGMEESDFRIGMGGETSASEEMLLVRGVDTGEVVTDVDGVEDGRSGTVPSGGKSGEGGVDLDDFSFIDFSS